MDGDTDVNVLIYPDGEVLFVPSRYLQPRCPWEGLNGNDPSAEIKCQFNFSSASYASDDLEMKIYSDKHYIDLADYINSAPYKVITLLSLL